MSEKLVFIDPAVKQETDRVIAEIRAGFAMLLKCLFSQTRYEDELFVYLTECAERDKESA